jgi:hypothetical protein
MSGAAQEDTTRYLILEAIRGETLLSTIYEKELQPVWHYLFEDTEWAPYKHQGPLIVEARQSSELYRALLAGLKDSTKMTGLILESDKGMDKVAEWARARLTVRLDKDRTALLRFYDPVIWHKLEPGEKANENPIGRAIYWHGSAGEGRWVMNPYPDPLTMSEMPILEPEQRKALAPA